MRDVCYIFHTERESCYKISVGSLLGATMILLTFFKGFFYYILLSLLFWGCARYAYNVNEQLPNNHPKKRNFPPAAVHLTIITWPIIVVAGAIYYSLLAMGYAALFVCKALLYGIFLILFTFALIFIRKPFLLIWLEKVARWVGGMMLEANAALLKLFQIPWVANPQPA